MSETTLAKTDWRIVGEHLGSCNCVWACPCQFNGVPDKGNCEALVAYQVREGHFGDVDLAGVRFAEMYWWPGPVHEGGGTCLIVLDEETTSAQRQAIEQITGGQQGHPYFEIFAAVAPNRFEMVVAPIKLDIDRDARQGSIDIPGVASSTVEPIHNPVTGDEHRVRIDLPNGFEYKQAEIANSVNWQVTAADPLNLRHENSYAQLFAFEWRSDGTTRTL